MTIEEKVREITLEDVKELQMMLSSVDAMEEVSKKPTAKIKILLTFIVYPFAMASYFWKALEHRDDVELKVTGPFTGSFIPWNYGMTLPEKYVKIPDLPLPFPPNIGKIPWDMVKTQLGDWKPDLVLNIDAGLNYTYKPTQGMVVTVGTDPHVLDYDHARKVSDKFFNMQLCYSKPGDIYLPYAYSQYDHYPMDGTIHATTDLTSPVMEIVPKDHDAVMIGLQYQKRVDLVNKLRAYNVSVIAENGPVYDDYRRLNNRARIGLNWSSLDDLNARAFELPAMKLAPVVNHVPDLGNFFVPGTHLLQFAEMDEALDHVLYLKDHDDERTKIADAAYQNVQGQTYDARVEQILKECGFLS